MAVLATELIRILQKAVTAYGPKLDCQCERDGGIGEPLVDTIELTPTIDNQPLIVI